MAFRVTYATLAAESDEVHGAFEAGLAELQPRLGARHGSIISGRERTEGPEVRRALPGRPGHPDRTVRHRVGGDVAEAVGAAKAYAPTWAATPWQERVRLLEAGADLISERRNVISALLTAGGGQEPAGVAGRRRGDGRPHPLLHPSAGRARRLRATDGSAEPGRGDVRRDAALRRVGRRHAVQLPGGAGRWTGRGRAGRRQHRGRSSRRRRAWAPRSRSPAACSTAACRPTRSTSSSAGDDGRPAAGGRRPDRRDHVHRLVRGRDAAPSGRRRRLPPTDHLRDGRQEPGHRQPAGRPGPGRRGHGSLGLRAVGTEVLGRVAGLRRASRGRGVRRAAGGQGQRHPARRSPRPGHVPGSGHRRRGGRALRAGDQRRGQRWRGAGRWPPGVRRRARPGHVRRAGGRPGPSRQLDPVDRAVRPAGGGRRRGLAGRGLRRWPTPRRSGSPPASSRPTLPRSTSSWSGSRPASST